MSKDQYFCFKEKMNNNSKIHFEISERRMILYLFDIIFVLGALFCIGFFFDFEYLEMTTAHFGWQIVFAIYLLVFGTIFEMYNLQVASNESQIVRSALLTVVSAVSIYLMTPVFSPELPSNRIEILVLYSVVLIALLGWRLFYVRYLASNRFFQNAILICDKGQVQELVLGLETIDPHYKIIAYVSTENNRPQNSAFENYIQEIDKNDLTTFIRQNTVSEIVIASQKADGITTVLYQQLLLLLESGYVIREYTQVYESKTYRIPVQFIERDFYRFFPFSRNNQNRLYLFFLRFFEISISIIGLFIGLLLIPFVMIGNAIGNRGKLFYTQERVGKNGDVFEIYKFRTMVKNAESKGNVFTVNNDKRVTSFGKFLRKTRIDEFPQFVNILKGDMAIIGPRPERPFFVKRIAKEMPFYETRHVIKPGLTGWAQVNYSYGETIEDSLIKLQYDLYYIKHRSIYLDLNIILKTITTVLFYRGQ